MAGPDKRKQSLYFPEDMLEEITREAIRLDRSLSWVVQCAWRIAREDVRKFPSVDPVAAAPPPAPSDSLPGAQVRDFLRGKFDNE